MVLASLRTEYWESLSRGSVELWVRVLRVHEVSLFLVFLVVLPILARNIDFGRKLAIPMVQNSTYHDIGLNPMHLYPIQLKGHSCWPADLNNCIEYPASSNPCCKELYNENSEIEQTVSDLELRLFVGFFSVGFLIMRCAAWFYYSRSSALRPNTTACLSDQNNAQGASSAQIDKRFWLKVLWDSFVALGICLVMTYVVTEFIKYAIAEARPNYYALQLFSSVHISKRTYIEENSQLSFPSGHASTSLAGMGIVSLFCFMDGTKFNHGAPLFSVFLLLVSLVPLLVAFYIGVTRMSDMWHFAWDVLAGWAIGATCVAISYEAFAGLSKNIFSILEPLVIDSQRDVESPYQLYAS